MRLRLRLRLRPIHHFPAPSFSHPNIGHPTCNARLPYQVQSSKVRWRGLTSLAVIVFPHLSLKLKLKLKPAVSRVAQTRIIDITTHREAKEEARRNTNTLVGSPLLGGLSKPHARKCGISSQSTLPLPRLAKCANTTSSRRTTTGAICPHFSTPYLLRARADL